MPRLNPLDLDLLRQPFSSSMIAIPGDPSYANCVNIWAGGRDRQPVAVYLCRSAEDVQTALRIARNYHLPVSVRGGGHDWGRRALCDGLVLDLSGMREVTLCDDGTTVRVGGGALASDVFAVTDPHGLAVVTGACGMVGMAGLTLGGGYGPLIGRFGLALDNLISADVVLADGARVTASEAENADLFWALRGGGGNFGVVVAMELRAHRLDSVYGGPVFYPMPAARAVLTNYASIAADMPDALTVQFALVSGPDGSPSLLVAPTWSGETADAEAGVKPLLAACDPAMSVLAHQPYGASTTIFGAHVVNGQRVIMDTRSVATFTSDVIGTLLDAFEKRPSAGCAIVTHEFRGAAARVALDKTAFGVRTPHVMIEIITGWNDAGIEQERAHAEWAADLSSALAPHALPGSYANFLAANDSKRAATSFGANASRIAALKQRFDPDNVFASALPLPPKDVGMGE